MDDKHLEIESKWTGNPGTKQIVNFIGFTGLVMAFWDDVFSHCDKSAGKMKDKTKEKVNNIDGNLGFFFLGLALKCSRDAANLCTVTPDLIAFLASQFLRTEMRKR